MTLTAKTIPPLDVSLDPDRCWPDLADGVYLEGALTHVALNPAGTVAGKPTVTLRITLPDGGTVLAQTSLALLDTARAAFRGRLGY